MKVLLIHPDFPRTISDRDAYISTLYPSASMNWLATQLSQNGHETKVLDSLMNYMLTGKGYRNDMMEGLDKLLPSFKPDVVGITIYSPARKVAFDVARKVKAFDRNIPVIVGGPHPTRMYKQIVEHYNNIVDYTFIGPSENSILPLLKSIEAGHEPDVQGIAYSRNKMLMDTGKGVAPDLENLPVPDYSAYLEHTPDRSLPAAYVMTSRGCTAHCRFCSNIWDQPLYRSPGHVLKEVDHLVTRCGIKRLIIYDDSFGMNKEHAIKVLEGIISLDTSLELLIMTRFDYLDMELLNLYKRAGGKEVFLGIETGSENLRRKMGKNLADEKLYSGAALMKEAGLKIGTFIMFGYPGETREDVLATYRMMEKLDPVQVFVNVTNVKPGDMNFELGIKKGDFAEDDWLDENRRLFTFLNKDQLELAVGCTFLFDDTFTKRKSKPDFEATAWINDGDLAERERLKSLAKSWLFDKND